ncbi:PAS domain-containing protein [Candidatus Saccharibacteria bacterium]|nr:PAS domain-containing protein [Candidatus Saccharibacteria bacterium]
MSLFSKKNSAPAVATAPTNSFAELALTTINDGVVVIDRAGVIMFINPAAATMLGQTDWHNALGLDYSLLFKIETIEGRELSEAENMLTQSVHTGQPLEGYEVCLISGPSNKKIPISVSVVPVKNAAGNRIITFRDITRELAEEGEQNEFVYTASHEMRTPVATIDGYLSLVLNPQTATIDERARGYLTSAQAAAKHLGHLFQDLLDTTKLDDGRIRPQFVPVEMVGLVKQISDGYIVSAKNKNIKFQFGSDDDAYASSHRIAQVVYASVDVNFMREIMGNLIENAIKYTPEGGSIYVNVRGDGDDVLINVTDTGMGISADDIGHIFQKFYRADNSDTRTVGGTGLGLYIVKQRVEAMGGRVWAESAFGEGSTFYVSLPRISGEEYEKRMIAYKNAMMVNQNNQGGNK